MKLYFINGSKQKKELIESYYADDLYDVLLDFFDKHHAYPHTLNIEMNEKDAIIRFESTSECFLIEGVDEDEYSEFSKLLATYSRK